MVDLVVTHAAWQGRMASRAAEAMLRALGGREVTVRFALLAVAGGDARQLGLSLRQVEDVQLGPAVVRGQDAEDGRSKVEVLFAAGALEGEMKARGAATAQELFAMADGVVIGDRVLRVEQVSAEFFAGMEYLYHVKVTE
ncbi:MAG TPA: hypothetical protein VN622_02510 [Clostridia bacterium]|nr:hypothetical protein [Clostridia bacterium]